jgi:hypothetical protein
MSISVMSEHQLRAGKRGDAAPAAVRGHHAGCNGPQLVILAVRVVKVGAGDAYEGDGQAPGGVVIEAGAEVAAVSVAALAQDAEVVAGVGPSGRPRDDVIELGGPDGERYSAAEAAAAIAFEYQPPDKGRYALTLTEPD